MVYSLLRVLILVSSIVHATSQAAPVCELDKLLSPCICHSNFGMIDLTMVASDDGPRFQDILTPNGDLVSYNPCLPFAEGACKNAALCLTTQNGTVIPIGTQESSYFASNADSATIYIIYSALGQDGIKRSAQVLLTCNPDQNPGLLIVNGETKPGSRLWDLNLQSMYACAQWYPPPLGLNQTDTEDLIENEKNGENTEDVDLFNFLVPDSTLIFEEDYEEILPESDDSSENIKAVGVANPDETYIKLSPEYINAVPKVNTGSRKAEMIHDASESLHLIYDSCYTWQLIAVGALFLNATCIFIIVVLLLKRRGTVQNQIYDMQSDFSSEDKKVLLS